jgi:tRNA A37 threonylcarbamoyladenosine modification protein TsaB
MRDLEAMRICALDASSGKVSVAIAVPGMQAKVFFGAEGGRGEALFDVVDAALLALRCEREAIDLWVAASGPGSFTGIRTALSAALGIGYALQKQTRAVSAFDVVCMQIDQPTLALLPSRPGEFYACACLPSTGLPGTGLPEHDSRALPLVPSFTLPDEWLRPSVRQEHDVQEFLVAHSMSKRLLANETMLSALDYLQAAQKGAGAASLAPMYVAPPRITTPRVDPTKHLSDGDRGGRR